MSTLEREMEPDFFTGEISKEAEKEQKEKDNVTYEAIDVKSFSRAAEEIILEYKDKQSFCFVDFDQTITGPDLRNVRDPQISDDVKESFNILLGAFSPGRLCFTTNRGHGNSFLGNLVFRTDKALKKMTEFLEESSYPGTVPIFLGLKKQVPNLKISGREQLINHLVSFIDNNAYKGRVKICMIEDYSLLGLDRSIFPKEIAREVIKRLREEAGKDIAIDIKDYVLKHK
jgi:hypothetical protein